MEQYWVWWILALVLVAAELATGTVYLLMIAIGITVGGIAAVIGASTPVQMMVAAIVTSIGCTWVYKRRSLQAPRVQVQRNTDVHLDVGNTVDVQHWDAHGQCTVQYRGTQWQARLDGFTKEYAHPKTGQYSIVAVESNLLVLAMQ